MQQNDPAELLEVFDAAGKPTGRAKTRAAVHLDGDWHMAFHCWILRSGSEVVLQRRSYAKDTFPGLWDASAAGHWRFGETPAEAAREIAEELGLAVAFEDLTYRRRERLTRRFPERGLIDREHHAVYALHLDLPLLEYAPDPREVIGLAAFSLADLIAVSLGHRRRALASEAVSVSPSGDLVPSPAAAERRDLVPYSAARLRRLLGSA